MITLPTTPGTYQAQGRAVNADQFASATASVVSGGRAHGCRALDLRVAGGIDLRLLPDRGLDVGGAWFGGVPLSWMSAVGECAPLPAPAGEDWIDRFAGGLVVTCGLRNVGVPSEGHGLHGRYSHCAARDVTVERTFDEGVAVLRASAVVEEVSALGPHLRVERAITTRTNRPLVRLVDTATNLRGVAEAAPLLYHVNIGAPLWAQGAQLHIDVAEVVPRDEDARAGLSRWMHPPDPDPSAPEQVFEHRFDTPADWRTARVRNPDLGLQLDLRWRADTLPRLHEWLHPAHGVLGVEPANSGVGGRAVDRAEGRLPVLHPGQSRTTVLEISAGPAG